MLLPVCMLPPCYCCCHWWLCRFSWCHVGILLVVAMPVLQCLGCVLSPVVAVPVLWHRICVAAPCMCASAVYVCQCHVCVPAPCAKLVWVQNIQETQQVSPDTNYNLKKQNIRTRTCQHWPSPTSYKLNKRL
jgi:hypothetical protein